MISHTRTVVGTKPLAAIVAEFRATIPPTPPRRPTGPGWIEATELRAQLGMGETAFSTLAAQQVREGVWQREVGTKRMSTGRLRSTRYYHVAPKKA